MIGRMSGGAGAKRNGSDKNTLGSKDVRAHNRESLEALLAHVDEQCRARCEEISERASAEADRIRETARDRADELLHEVRERERRNLDERVRVERARQQSRIRQRELAERLAMAEQGLEFVREELVSIWKSGKREQAGWLERTLADARAVLTDDQWRLRHPDDWSPDKAAVELAERVAAGVEIDWQADPALAEGFVVGAGKALVDATPAGLTARGERIAGVLLAQMGELDSPALDTQAVDSEETS